MSDSATRVGSPTQSVLCATLSPKIIPGADQEQLKADPCWRHSRGHYGHERLMAYAAIADCSIVIVEMVSMQLVQTLCGHQTYVTAVRWKRHESAAMPHKPLQLASGDSGGRVILWDVTEGVITRSVQTEHHYAIHQLRFTYSLSSNYLTVWLENGNILTFDDCLSSEKPLQSSGRVCGLKPRSLAVSKICPADTCAIVSEDELTVFNLNDDGAIEVQRRMHVEVGNEENAFQSLCFSSTQPEVIFIAMRSSISTYDWKLDLELETNFAWLPKDVHFVTLFSSWVPSIDCTGSIPSFYSFSSDMKLTAWFVEPDYSFKTISTDVRGHRLPTKYHYIVLQSFEDPTRFAAILSDGTTVGWCFDIDMLIWRITGHLEAPQRAHRLCMIDSMTSCSASEMGCVTVYSILHSQMISKYQVLHSGNVSVSALCRASSTGVWLTTTRTLRGKCHSQISYLDLQTGEITSILRKSPYHPDPGAVQEVKVNPEGNLLLLRFVVNAFEVWDIAAKAPIHVQSGHGIINACWGPLGSTISNQLPPRSVVAVMPEDGGVQFLIPARGQLQKLRENYPLRLASAGSGIALSLTLDDLMICFDANCNASVIRGFSSGYKWSSLSSFHKAPILDAQLSRSEDGERLVGCTFADGAFGVWNPHTRKRIGFSWDGGLHIEARRVCWGYQQHLVILTRYGSVAVVDKTCMAINSSVYSKCLSRELRTPAFLLPSHATHLYARMLLTSFENNFPLLPEVRSGDHLDGEDSQDKTFPSFLIQRCPLPRPCRGSFGQLISMEINTLEDELNLLIKLVPPDLIDQIQVAAKNQDVAKLGFLAARYFGQERYEKFWLSVRDSAKDWLERDDPHNFSAARQLSPPLVATSVVSPDVVDNSSFDSPTSTIPPQERLFVLPDPFSPCLSDPDVAKANRMSLNIRRAISLARHSRSGNVDNSIARLKVSREYISMGELKRATDILIDSPSDFDSFYSNATLACAVAASGHRPLCDELVITTKRAAVMLMSKGDIDGAVEKFSLLGENYEGCLALQANGRWFDAALQAQLSDMPVTSRADLFNRWAMHHSRKGNTLTAARLLLQLRSPRQALGVLSQSVELTDLAGMFALFLLVTMKTLLPPEGMKNQILVELSSEVSESLIDCLKQVLKDYSSLLKGTHCQREARFVDDVVSDLTANSPLPSSSQLHSLEDAFSSGTQVINVKSKESVEPAVPLPTENSKLPAKNVSFAPVAT